VTRKAGSEAYGRLAERQAARWDRMGRTSEAGKHAPAVTLSRLPGAGGEEVGHLVAERLDYGFFGREIVERVAEELHVGHWVVQGLDEQVRGGIERSLWDLFGQGSFSEDTYLRAVTRSIATLGRRGGVVIVGRGAPFILPADQALRVLLVAPRPTRVERYAKVLGIGPHEAEAELARAERQRETFALRQFGVRQTDPVLYDLMVNTGGLDPQAAADLVVHALRLRFPDAGVPATPERRSP
jgi:cytidylate kinase